MRVSIRTQTVDVSQGDPQFSENINQGRSISSIVKRSISFPVKRDHLYGQILKAIRDLMIEHFHEKQEISEDVLADIIGSVDKLFHEVAAFLTSIAKEGITFTERDNSAMLVLIFPRNFGPSTNKEIGMKKRLTRVYKAL